MPISRYAASAVLIVAAILGGAGCQSGVPLAPVKGTVTLDGNPLRKGTIRFESAGRPATGKIENGAIVEVTTFHDGDGAPIGAHKVAFWANEDADSAVVPDPGQSKVGANYMGGKSILPVKYNDPDTSGETAEIKAGQNVVEFKLVSN